VVDDSTVSRRILASLLESAGLQVITATGGIEGMALARQHRPDVILMDVKMPDLDGFSATRQLSADEAARNIPVIAVTASAFGDTRKAALEAGCVDYLPKPVRVEALFAALQKHLSVEFTWESEGEPPASGAIAPAPHHAVLAAQLREAAAIGAITDLHAIANTLAIGNDADVDLGRRVGALAASFDFDGVRELAASLDAAQDSSNAP